MGLRRRLRRVEHEARGRLLAIPQRDGTELLFHGDALLEALAIYFARLRASLNGEEMPPAHPVVDALRNARGLSAIAAEHGTMVHMLVEEEAVLRGEAQRPGPAVVYDEEGKVCR